MLARRPDAERLLSRRSGVRIPLGRPIPEMIHRSVPANFQSPILDHVRAMYGQSINTRGCPSTRRVGSELEYFMLGPPPRSWLAGWKSMSERHLTCHQNCALNPRFGLAFKLTAEDLLTRVSAGRPSSAHDSH
ncbi:hypothethical protein [Ralstonia solanacearum PSI07]|nr:hypothethical protein [Ralstonia solanacearum PSI07]